MESWVSVGPKWAAAGKGLKPWGEFHEEHTLEVSVYKEAVKHGGGMALPGIMPGEEQDSAWGNTDI